ncbi:hypothetical protein GWI33_013471 [Rhynchophorus ferrugineus]|uniref:C-type lectin domain-containing protein n=1 Tax=Rhynchophorus ferrugineus TaxID=354439 RepID=A0A834MBJ8_RHYFE|nr:hypothetical protein GWI33_013471 [Rhynchophorus ferrugineus]
MFYKVLGSVLFILTLSKANIGGCKPPKTYVASNDRMGFHNAFITCRQYGFEPAEIHTVEEHIMVEKLLKHEKAGLEHGFWIFATNLDDKKSYYWLNSGRRLFYSNFSKGQPDNFKDNENCVQVFHISPGHFAWNDLPCTSQIRFLCQHYQEEKNQEACEGNRVSNC